MRPRTVDWSEAAVLETILPVQRTMVSSDPVITSRFKSEIGIGFAAMRGSLAKIECVVRRPFSRTRLPAEKGWPERQSQYSRQWKSQARPGLSGLRSPPLRQSIRIRNWVALHFKQ